jgi:hypothetical protein
MHLSAETSVIIARIPILILVSVFDIYRIGRCIPVSTGRTSTITEATLPANAWGSEARDAFAGNRPAFKAGQKYLPRAQVDFVGPREL